MICRRVVAAFAMGFLVLLVVGCGGGGGSSSSGGGTTTGTGGGGGGTAAAKSLYVSTVPVAFGTPPPSSLLQFSEDATASATPVSTLTGPAGVQFNSVTIDSAGKLYVGGQTFGMGNTGLDMAEVLVYAAGSTGTAKPLATLTLPGLFNDLLADVEVDEAGNIYVLADVAVGTGMAGRVYSGITVFAPSATGYVIARTIAGPTTQIQAMNEMAVSPTGTIYVTGGQNGLTPEPVLLFNAGATGDVPPDGVLSGDATTIGNVRGMTFDAAGNLYVTSLAEVPFPATPLSGTPSVLEFAAGATGNVAPMRTISGALTTMGEIGSVRVDSAGDLYVVNGFIAGSVLKFAAGATGNVAPMATFALPTNSGTYASGVAVQ